MGGKKWLAPRPLSAILVSKFDVYPNPDGIGYLLDVQANLLEDLNTRVIVPLIPIDQAPEPTKRLNPIFRIDDADVVMLTHFLASVPRTVLRNPIKNLSENFAEITNALDMVFQGF